MTRFLNSLTTRTLSLTLLAAVLTGCGGGSALRDDLSPATKRGGYYQDDGPAANIPADVANTPDAVPRWEPLNRGTARPYTVLGRSYTPMTQLAPYKGRGIATWYGKKFHGRKTATGEPYDMFAMSAAHTTLPLPSYARVTHLASGRQVVVRVNDRGPFHPGRIIDLSYAAAAKLGIVQQGSAEVEVELILPGEDGGTAYAEVAPPRRPAADAKSADPLGGLIDRIDERRAPPPPGFYVQLGAFAEQDNADAYIRHVSVELDGLNPPLKIYTLDEMHRVQSGPYASRAAAERARDRIRDVVGGEPALAYRAAP